MTNNISTRGSVCGARRAKLERLLTVPPPGLRFGDAIAGNGPKIFLHACQLGLEGIVSKRLDSAYRSGRSSAWLKAKNPGFVRR